MKMNTAYLGLGSNSADKELMLRRARILISTCMGSIERKSKIYKTAPWGYLDQDDFINQVIAVKTSLDIRSLHEALLLTEKTLDKQKDSKYGPRNIDIDILFYDQSIYDTDDLKIPHPRMHERNFVLIPLSEIASEVVHPVFKKTIKYLAGVCKDNGSVTPQENESQ